MEVKTLLSGEDRSLGATLIRAALTPLAWLHQIGLEIYLLPYHLGIRKRFRLPVPTVAIGNLSSGGTGKTPMAALVAQLLREEGLRVVLLSRGHGGSHERGKGAQIVSRGDGDVLLAPEVAGDEPVLLARLLPDVPVVVGRDRRVSGQLAVSEFQPDVILLDDALQFWQLHRNLDIVLLDARRPFDNGFVLPRGLLREPPSHLKRAGLVVLTRADRVAPEAVQATQATVARLAPRACVLTASHCPKEWRSLCTEAVYPLDTPLKEPTVAFAGIADSEAFFSTVRTLGNTPIFYCDFGDHHAYNKEELESLRQRAEDATFLTTEKDGVKVAPLWPDSGPDLLALRIGLELSDPEQLRTVLKHTYVQARGDRDSKGTRSRAVHQEHVGGDQPPSA